MIIYLYLYLYLPQQGNHMSSAALGCGGGAVVSVAAAGACLSLKGLAQLSQVTPCAKEISVTCPFPSVLCLIHLSRLLHSYRARHIRRLLTYSFTFNPHKLISSVALQGTHRQAFLLSRFSVLSSQTHLICCTAAGHAPSDLHTPYSIPHRLISRLLHTSSVFALQGTHCQASAAVAAVVVPLVQSCLPGL